MKNIINNSIRTERGIGFAMSAIGAAVLLSVASVAYCDEPLSMAPPIQADASQGATVDTPSVSADNVFNWTEVPQNQNVPITRAVFDQGGYQLFDTADETIVIPFTDNNLYVMKFAVSDTGDMYFVNTGSDPVLYVPDNGYLENAAVPGAEWYPFTPDFQPAAPVFLGCAPSWSTFVDMGWYPSMSIYGGYWCDGPVFEVGALFPTVGIVFEIGGEHYNGWAPFHDYYEHHRAPYSMTVVNNNVYNWAKPVYARNRQFGGERESRQTNAPAGGRVFQGSGHPYLVTGTGSPHSEIGRPIVASQAATSRPNHIFLGASRPTAVGNSGSWGQANSGAIARPNRATNQAYTLPPQTSRQFVGISRSTDPQPSAGNQSSHAVSPSSGGNSQAGGNNQRWSR